MPPSTATYVRPCGILLTVPTRYRVIAAGAAIERPGSTIRRGTSPIPASATHFFTVVRSVDSYSANDTSGSVARYRDASPPPMLSSSTRAPVDSSIAPQSSTTIATARA